MFAGASFTILHLFVIDTLNNDRVNIIAFFIPALRGSGSRIRAKNKNWRSLKWRNWCCLIKLLEVLTLEVDLKLNKCPGYPPKIIILEHLEQQEACHILS